MQFYSFFTYEFTIFYDRITELTTIFLTIYYGISLFFSHQKKKKQFARLLCKIIHHFATLTYANKFFLSSSVRYTFSYSFLLIAKKCSVLSCNYKLCKYWRKKKTNTPRRICQQWNIFTLIYTCINWRKHYLMIWKNV